MPGQSPSGDLQSKINRAIRAWLINQGAVAAANCITAPSSAKRPLPLTDIDADRIKQGATPADGPGNWHFANVSIILEDSAVVLPGDDPDSQRVLANDHFTAVWSALNQSDDGTTIFYTGYQITLAGQALAVDASNGADPVQAQSAADNSDMVDFTILALWQGLEGTAAKSADGTFWSREIGFSCVACNANLLP